MKSVLISIQPKWCELIASGKKTLEVRKSRPKLDTPFKCYIYCTKDKHGWFDFGKKERLDGKVIGEFVCDDIRCFDIPYPAFQKELDKTILEQSCCTYYALHRYAYHDALYGWHISDLKIYEKPKSLKGFRNPCREYEKDNPQCGSCDYYHSMGEYPAECGCDGAKPMIRPPQSWCYVEEVSGNG
jgi:predicted transcriptional regulator